MADIRKKLLPVAPPGRTTRKAREFSAEVCELRELGYTFEAIRAALAAAGVEVSNRTVQREVARGAKLALPPVQTDRLDTPTGGAEPERRTLVLRDEPDAAVRADPRNGKEIAEAFMKGRSNNPLFRNRSNP